MHSAQLPTYPPVDRRACITLLQHGFERCILLQRVAKPKLIPQIDSLLQADFDVRAAAQTAQQNAKPSPNRHDFSQFGEGCVENPFGSGSADWLTAERFRLPPGVEQSC